MIRRLLAIAATIIATTAFGGSVIGDGPVIRTHVDQRKIDAGELSFQQIFDAGKFLFSAKFNTFDGQGRPGTRGDGVARVPGSAPAFIRTSGPEANSCAGCHNDPAPGGAGDIVANVFVLAQTLDPVTPSVGAETSDERNTLGMNGSGAIELLAREMSNDLIAIRGAAIVQARATGASVSRALVAKGIAFGSIVARPDGSVDTTGVHGVSSDLIIRPFHQKGVVISLREFTNNAFNHHHGMQSVERFGPGDPDGDGVSGELTVGDVTATTIWQAALNTPGQVIPNDPAAARAVIRGERTFSHIGCAACHVPELELESGAFTEPNPFNKAGNLQVQDVPRPFSFDIAAEGPLPRPERTPEGRVVVRAFTDLKRHDLCDAQFDHFCNERIVQGGVSTREFLTRKLWDAGSSAPYGHRGDLTTLTEAILAHGGEGRAARDAFAGLPQTSRDDVVEFLESLQVLPEGTPGLVVDDQYHALDATAIAAILERSQS